MKKPKDPRELTSVFAATTYRQVLQADLAQHGDVRGYQKRLADAAGCRPSYLSQVLHSHVQLTLDQAAGLAAFWRMGDNETEYFLALVGAERSSTAFLRRHLQGRMQLLREANSRLSCRVKSKAGLPAEAQAYYYATWYTPAIHVLVGIKTLRTPQALSQHLRLPLSLVQASLARLVDLGLVAAENGGYLPTESSLHLDDQSPFHSVYHGNWRQQAVVRTQQRSGEEVQYTALYALSAEAAAAIREQLMAFAARSRETALAATGETQVVALLCDFFRV